MRWVVTLRAAQAGVVAAAHTRVRRGPARELHGGSVPQGGAALGGRGRGPPSPPGGLRGVCPCRARCTLCWGDCVCARTRVSLPLGDAHGPHCSRLRCPGGAGSIPWRCSAGLGTHGGSAMGGHSRQPASWPVEQLLEKALARRSRRCEMQEDGELPPPWFGEEQAGPLGLALGPINAESRMASMRCDACCRGATLSWCAACCRGATLSWCDACCGAVPGPAPPAKPKPQKVLCRLVSPGPAALPSLRIPGGSVVPRCRLQHTSLFAHLHADFDPISRVVQSVLPIPAWHSRALGLSGVTATGRVSPGPGHLPRVPLAVPRQGSQAEARGDPRCRPEAPLAGGGRGCCPVAVPASLRRD